MKISLVLIGSVSATALAGIAVAQASRASWPQIDIADLEQCRPVIAQVHKIEEAYIRQVTSRECNAPARYYSTESCRTARRWLAKTEAQDDAVWFFEGNDRCQGTDYPCFGVKIYNTPRSGDEARRWAKYFNDKAARPFSVTRGMDLWTAAREADTCVSGIWAAKYRDMNEPPPAPPPVQVAEAPPPAAPPAPVQVAEVQPPAAPPPAEPQEIPAAQPETAAVAALQAVAAPAATATATATETAAATAIAAATTATTTAAAKPAKKTTASKDPMAAVIALIEEGKTAEAIAAGDKLAATQPAGEGQLTACKTRVLARQDLDKALVACYSTGKPSDPAVLETRGQLHLLAGRHQDAWNDFNAAFSANNSNATLYMRGLAAAGMGKTADALKDLAKAEAGEQGIMAGYEAKGFTLASVMSGKPLVEAAAPVAAAAAPVAAAAAPAVDAPVAAAAAVVEEPVVPLPNAVYPPAEVAAAPAAPTEVPVAPEVAVPVPVAVAPAVAAVAPPVAAAPTVAAAIPAAEPATAPASFAASTGSAVAVPGISLPAVTDCLTPVAPGNGGRGAFKNKCNYPVRFTYCNIKGADSVPQLTCGSDTKFRAETIGGNSSAAATLGQSVAYFACRSPTLPEVIYTSNNGLEGYCR